MRGKPPTRDGEERPVASCLCLRYLWEANPTSEARRALGGPRWMDAFATIGLPAGWAPGPRSSACSRRPLLGALIKCLGVSLRANGIHLKPRHCEDMAR